MVSIHWNCFGVGGWAWFGSFLLLSPNSWQLSKYRREIYKRSGVVADMCVVLRGFDWQSFGGCLAANKFL